MDAALKKLFAQLDEFGKRLESLEALEARLTKLDTNGQLEEIRKEMIHVAANSRLVVNQVEANGQMIASMEKTIARLNVRCPLMKPETDEFPQVMERLKLKDE